jgi:hypothetical protein
VRLGFRDRGLVIGRNIWEQAFVTSLCPDFRPVSLVLGFTPVLIPYLSFTSSIVTYGEAFPNKHLYVAQLWYDETEQRLNRTQ